MLGIFKKTFGENDCCRYCKHIKLENNEYICKYKGNVSAADVCGKYSFDPFAHRVPRKRGLDTSVFDPLDFKLD